MDQTRKNPIDTVDAVNSVNTVNTVNAVDSAASAEASGKTPLTPARSKTPDTLSLFFLPSTLIPTLVPQTPSNTLILDQDSTPLSPSTNNDNNNDHNQNSTTNVTRNANIRPISHSTGPTGAIASALVSVLPSCRVCGIDKFDSVERQREHVRLDWHRFNLKQKHADKNAAPVSEQAFEDMIQDLSSLSGSDTESDESDDNGRGGKANNSNNSNNNNSQDDVVRNLMKKLEISKQKNAGAQDPVLLHQQQVLEDQLKQAKMSPLHWFTSPLYAPNVRLGIYKHAMPIALSSPDQQPDLLRAIQALQIKSPQQLRAKQQQVPQSPAAGNTAVPRYWTMLMLGGGHFAGLVVDLAGQVTTHGRDIKVVAHKTFHRYTVRRKQGGGQGANDSANGKANSAGAQIRRYNEEALKAEVRAQLESWSPYIRQSERVFMHAPSGNKKIVFYEGSVLSTADKEGRLKSFPFVTRRPTLNELKRSFQELSTIKVTTLSEEALMDLERKEREGLEKAVEMAAAANAVNTGEIGGANKDGKVGSNAVVLPELLPEMAKLIELVKKGRVEAMSSHLMKFGIDPSQLLPVTSSTEYDTRRTPTILHVASHHGQAGIIKALLEKHFTDPTVTTTVAANNATDVEGEEELETLGMSTLTAYDVAKDKDTRNAFRRAMAMYPDNWDWTGLGHVPSALTPEMEAEQERKAKEKTRKLLDAERERKKDRENAKPSTSAGTSPKLASTSTVNAASKQKSLSSSILSRSVATMQQTNTSLTPEMKMRLERERRARAAEARMAAQQQQQAIRTAVADGKEVCVSCGKSLTTLGHPAFDKFGKKFCSTDCVNKGPA